MPLRTQSRARLLITFAHIVEAGSITSAARTLGIDKASVSRQLRELEEQLGVHLLHRGGQSFHVTEIGHSVYRRAARLIEEVESAVGDAECARDVPMGVLTVSASVAMGKPLLLRSLIEFARIHPQIEVELCLLDRFVHPAEDGFDLLLRICKEPPEDMVAHRLADIRYVVVAAPALVREGPEVTEPSDLAQRQCLFYGFKRRRSTWSFRRGNEHLSVEVSTSLSINSGEAIREAALAGFGFALLPSFLVFDDIACGRLQPLLVDQEVQGDLGTALYALHLPGRMSSPKVRALVQHLKRDWPTSAWDAWRGQPSDGAARAPALA